MDELAIGSISPVDLSTYLRSKHWRRGAEVAGGLGQTWHWNLGENEIVDVIVPSDRTLRDFHKRTSEVVQTLGSIENRSQREIVADIQQVSTDVIRWRWIQESADDGTIPLEQGKELIDQVRSQLLAAACSAATPKLFFASRKPAAATEYMKQARLGQSERGSYVVTVQSPVPPIISSLGGEEEVPFERKVTTKLAQALQKLRHLASDAVAGSMPDPGLILQSGISANLCETVAAMLGTDKVRRDVEIRLSFASSRPAPAGIPLVTRFSSDLSPIIGVIGKALREGATREDFELIGFVTELKREPQAEKGRAVILGLVDDDYRRVELSVSTPDYEKVLLAHSERRMIRCEGELEKVGGQTYRLSNARGFEAHASD